MKRIVLLSLALFVSLQVFSQKGNINGFVKTSDGKPAEFVAVGLKGISKSTYTQSNGKYELKNIEPGDYILITSLMGLESKQVNINVRANETTSVPDISLSEDAITLNEVIVSTNANRYNKKTPSSSLRIKTPLLEVPQNIQIVTGAVLKDQQIISMSDGLVRNVSGLVRAEHWGDMYTNITARGSQVQAFRNGFNVVNSYWGPLTEDMSFVENIEFVKGPAGFMLSSGDPSGLYNVVTKKPTGEQKGEVSFTVGSFDLYRSTVDLDGKLSKDGKLLYRLNLSAQNKGSFRANEYNDRYAIAPVISYQLDDKTKFTAEYTYQRANMSNVGSYYVFGTNGFKTLPVDFSSLPAGTEGTKINDHSFLAIMTHDFNDKWKFTGQLSRYVYDQVGSSMWPTSVDSNGKIIRNIGIWDSRSLMSMAQFFVNGEAQTGGIKHRILGGLDMGSKTYLADWGQSHDLDTVGAEFDPQNPYLGSPVNGYPVFDRTTPLAQRANKAGGLMSQNYSAIYIQDELGFFDNKLRLTLASRYTFLKQSAWGGKADSASHITPRIGLSGSINKNTTTYALYDESFIPQSGRMTNGKKVQPITGNNMELGLKRDWMGGKWNTTLAVYRILKNNELTADPKSPPAAGLSVELGQKTSQGVEFDLRGNITEGFNVVVNYAYTDSRVTKVTDGVTVAKVGDIVPGFAKHTANAWLSYKLTRGAVKGLGINGGVTALMDRATYWEASPDPSKEIEDYLKVDGGLFWENDKIKITANVFNALNEYLYSGSYYSYPKSYNWQAEAPRNFRLSLNYRF